jgi:hypothetical protein
LKNVRNNFKKQGFCTEKGQIKWDFVEKLYAFDQENSVRLAYKLTDKHITLPAFSTLRVKYAAQVLSHSVAAGVSFLAHLGGGSPDTDAIATAEFIERFDQLFNAFNSGNLCSKQKMGHGMSERSGHTTFLLETLDWLQTVIPCSGKKKKKSLPCLSGWRMDIRALLGLWDDLKDNHGLRFLMTERLTQDCIENLFSQIRGSGGHIANPSAAQFRTFIRRAMVDSIIVHKEQSNSKEDAAKFLLSVKDISRRGNTEKESGCILPAERVVVNPAEPDYEGDHDDQLDDLDQIDDDQNE